MQVRHVRISPKKAAPDKKRRKTPVPRPLARSLGRFASVLACCAAIAAGTARTDAATFYWDNDSTAAGNTTAGAGLGGTGTWDIVSPKWWNGVADVAWVNGGNDAIFAGTPGTVTLGLPITATALTFLADGYTLSGSTLTLSSGIINVAFSDTAGISSVLTGSGGLTINGGGGVRLTNIGNNYTGTTTINNGSLIISDGAAVNNTTETSTILVNGSIVRGAGGGSLVLDGNSVNGVTLSRNIDIMGLGPIADRGVPLISIRNNILSGKVSRSIGNTNNTQIYSAGGLLQFAGTLNLS